MITLNFAEARQKFMKFDKQLQQSAASREIKIVALIFLGEKRRKIRKIEKSRRSGMATSSTISIVL